MRLMFQSRFASGSLVLFESISDDDEDEPEFVSLGGDFDPAPSADDECDEADDRFGFRPQARHG